MARGQDTAADLRRQVGRETYTQGTLFSDPVPRADDYHGTGEPADAVADNARVDRGPGGGYGRKARRYQEDARREANRTW